MRRRPAPAIVANGAGRVTLIPIRVYYEDTDASGVVYHANYLRYFERARTEWLRELGFSQHSLMKEEGVAFTLANIELCFQRPARLDDELIVSARVSRHGRASIEFEQDIKYARDGVVLTTAAARCGCVDAATFKPRAVPTSILKGMDE
jgi:acyl-CoA thioester hydrolase